MWSSLTVLQITCALVFWRLSEVLAYQGFHSVVNVSVVCNLPRILTWGVIQFSRGQKCDLSSPLLHSCLFWRFHQCEHAGTVAELYYCWGMINLIPLLQTPVWSGQPTLLLPNRTRTSWVPYIGVTLLQVKSSGNRRRECLPSCYL